MSTRVATLEDLRPFVGSELGTSSWVEISQDRIDRFAEATGDHQWIHVDPDRARSGPFGTTVAHGYLTLSLLLPLCSELFEVESVSAKVNYGLDRVRFPAPVPAGSRLRARLVLAGLEQVRGGAQLVLAVTGELEGGARPACVAEMIVRFYE